MAVAADELGCVFLYYHPLHKHEIMKEVKSDLVFSSLVLLERVFLRIGSAESDEQLQNAVAKFLPPVLLKLSSQQEGVRKKVMELLIHINKRIKSRPLVQLPVEALLVQYQDPAASSFVINFTIIYIKLGFPRLPIEKQVELVPSMLNSIDSKPQQHQDSLLLLIIPLLGKMELPTDPVKKSSLFGFNEKPHTAKHLLGLLLDMLLLPYGALTQKTGESEQSNGNDVSLPVPSGMSEHSFKRVTNENPLRPEELEQIKLGCVKFLASSVYPDEEILVHLVVAAADTRFSVANLADLELKKVVSSVDWTSPLVPMPLHFLFLGSQSQTVKPNMKKLPANTRIRLKLLTHMCRITGTGFVLPASIQIIFDSLYGLNTNSKLKTLSLNFAMNLVRTADEVNLRKVASVLQAGLQKLIREGEAIHQGQAFLILGFLGSRFPLVTYPNVALLEMFFKNLESANPDLRLQIREGFLSLIPAYRYDVNPKEFDKDGRISFLFALVKYYLFSEEPMVRFVAVRSIGTIFPPDHVASKFLLLLATGDSKDEVSMEAFKSLYGTSRKGDVDLATVNKTTGAPKVVLPAFEEITKYVYVEAETRVKDGSKRVNVGNHVLPYTTNVYNEILIYLRLCLIQNLDVPLTREIIRHPSEYTPIIRTRLLDLYDDSGFIDKNSLLQYASLVRQLFIANPAIEPLCCMLEVIGCVPKLSCCLLNNLDWVRDLMNSTKEEIREFAALLYSVVINQVLMGNHFEKAVEGLVANIANKSLEAQHGAVFGIANAIERKIMLDKASHTDFSDWGLFKNCINIIVPFLTHQNPLLISAASVAVGQLGRCTALPLDNGKAPSNGSPDAKRPANGKITKISIANQLLEIMKNIKLSSKIRERAAKSLGLICVGEEFPHSKEVIQGFLDTAKETKDVEVHFTAGESLVMCVQSIWSPEARDPWITPATDFTPSNTMLEGPADDNLSWLLDELLKFVGDTHPNSRQASCIWLLALLKNCSNREPVKARLKVFQNAFMDLLGENNDIVQDVASKGLCLVYDNSKSEELLDVLVSQLTSGRRQVAQVTSSTKLFEEGELGKAPTGGNLSTYKELCSLASDLNKPDLIYQFMHLANHNAIWNSKKGAAFGFSSIAEKCGEHLQPHLPKIVPKLYRYQYDSTPNLQASMQNIWHVLVPETQKTLEQYHDEILADLLENLTSPQYRVRQSCCLALQDFLKGAGNKSIHDSVDHIEELWLALFRVMDDHHEPTRLIAAKTTKVLSRLCVRACDAGQGKAGVKMVQSILPVLLNVGITNPVAEVRSISLQTVSELVGAAGNQLKPFLPQLIPALLQATGELESSKLSYFSTMLGGQSQAQEVVDSARANFAKSHFTTETVGKCLQYADASILEELTPKVTELMKASVGLGTRVVCAHFITLLVVQLGQDMQAYTGKFLAALVNGLTDRNAAIRKHYASTIGHLVSTAKESSLEKLFAKIQHWYFEREDDSIRSACAQTIQSISNHNQEILKTHSEVILPLVFFAMHGEKTPETESTIEVWNEIWSENSPGTESGIRQNIEVICDTLKMALESPSWTMKAQGANAVSTVANKLGSSLELKHRNALIQILLNGLSGRTWNGKDKLLKALASICAGCKESLKTDKELDLNLIIDAVLRESRKEEIVYKISALKSLGEILSALQVDKFDEVYHIAQAVLIENSSASKDDDEDMSSEEVSKKRENGIKIKEVVYETLGKAWPENCKATQEKYRELFVEHCADCLPKNTRSVQVCVITALRDYVDKLLLLKDDKLSKEDEESLTKIVDDIIKVAVYALGISKHTRLRKETLSVVFSIATKLKEKSRHTEFNKIAKMFTDILPELSKDNQPEIKSRVTDIKNLLNKD